MHEPRRTSVGARWLVGLVGLLMAGCETGSSTPNDAAVGTGGGSAGADAATGGASGSGGRSAGADAATGGASGSGGRSAGADAATGGALGSGGRSGSGGAATGGASGSGGTSGSGGRSGSGGASGPGGRAGSGGMSGSGGSAGGGSLVAGCRIFPPDNPWNQDVSAAPVKSNSVAYISNMAPTAGLHPDWGTMTDQYGIPFTAGTGSLPQPMTWTASWGASESDVLPCPTGTNRFCYPIPLTAPIEGGPGAATGSDRHVLYIDTAGAPNDCTLYEIYNAQNPTGSGWRAQNGAIFHLGSNALRPDGWTSGDAAGLPVLPGLVRLDEVMAGEIRHAIRFTVARTSNGYIHPATHFAGESNTALPPMGLRLRLKAGFDVSGFSGATLVILNAMKKYGVILADNGSNWFITGESHNGWNPIMGAIVSNLARVHGSDFEVIETGPVLTN